MSFSRYSANNSMSRFAARKDMSSNAEIQTSAKRQKAASPEMFAVHRMNKVEQWTSEEIEKAAGIDAANVKHKLGLGFEFCVNPDGTIVTRKGKDFNEELYKRFGPLVFSSGTFSD
jgi:hypothetical protein